MPNCGVYAKLRHLKRTTERLPLYPVLLRSLPSQTQKGRSATVVSCLRAATGVFTALCRGNRPPQRSGRLRVLHLSQRQWRLEAFSLSGTAGGRTFTQFVQQQLHNKQNHSDDLRQQHSQQQPQQQQQQQQQQEYQQLHQRQHVRRCQPPPQNTARRKTAQHPAAHRRQRWDRSWASFTTSGDLAQAVMESLAAGSLPTTRQVPAALQRLAALLQEEGHLTPPAQQHGLAVKVLTGHVLNDLDSLSPAALCKCIWIWAGLGLGKGPAVTHAMEHLWRRRAGLALQSMPQLAAALALLPVEADSQRWRARWVEVLASHARELAAASLAADVVQAYARMGHPAAQLFTGLMTHIPSAGPLAPRKAAAVAWAYSRMGYHCSQPSVAWLMVFLERQVMQSGAQRDPGRRALSASDAASAAWGFARAGYVSESLADMLAAECLHGMPELPVDDLCAAAWAFAAWGRRCPALESELRHYSLARADMFSPWHQAQMSWALDRLQRLDADVASAEPLCIATQPGPAPAAPAAPAPEPAPEPASTSTSVPTLVHHLYSVGWSHGQGSEPGPDLASMLVSRPLLGEEWDRQQHSARESRPLVLAARNSLYGLH